MTFFQNLWRDLVDKKLWPVAVALLLAAIAVPFLIDTGSSEDSAAAPAPVVAPQDTTGDVTVATTDTAKQQGRSGKSRDPFKPLIFAKVAKTAQAANGAANGATAPPSATGASGAAAAGSSGTSGASSGTATKSGSTSSGTTTSGTTGTTGTTGVTTPATPPTTSSSTKLLDYAISYESKRLGDVTTRRNVRAVNYVPSKDYPLLAFVGIKPDGKTAVFTPQDRVVVAGRDKECTPGSGDCQFLELQAGDSILIHKNPKAGSDQPIVHIRFALTRIALTEVSRSTSRSATSRSITRAAQVARTVRATG